jgi:hypothetical protein
MIITLRLPCNKTLKVKAHRILKNRFPKLELYIHYGVAKNKKTYTTNFYGVSTKDGFAIGDSNYCSAYKIVEKTQSIISFFTEEKVIKRNELLKAVI